MRYSYWWEKPLQGNEWCLAPAINNTCQRLRIWASVDLLFGSPDSLAKFPEAKGGGRRGEVGGMNDWMYWETCLCFDLITEAESVSHSCISTDLLSDHPTFNTYLTHYWGLKKIWSRIQQALHLALKTVWWECHGRVLWVESWWWTACNDGLCTVTARRKESHWIAELHLSRPSNVPFVFY